MKKRNSNRVVLVLVVSLSALLLVACGSGGGDSAPSEPQVAPAISNLQYSPTSATVGQGGGVVTVTGTIDFIDENRTKPSSKKSSSQKPADPKNIGSKYN